MDYLEDISIAYIYCVTAMIILLVVIYVTVPVVHSMIGSINSFLCYLHWKGICYTPVTYLNDDCLSPVSKRRLTLVQRKVLILDMDETLLSAILHYSNRETQRVLPTVSNDYTYYIGNKTVTVYLYKRPHVDLFLDRVSKWYDLVVFTAATESYATKALDYLDAGRNILNTRFYRHHCDNFYGLRAKFVSVVHNDLANVLLLDDSIVSICFNLGNSVKIKPFKGGTRDDHLLRMLPFLDALRFTKDVRSILGRAVTLERYALPKYFQKYVYAEFDNVRKYNLEEEPEEYYDDEEGNFSDDDADQYFSVEQFEPTADGFYYE